MKNLVASNNEKINCLKNEESRIEWLLRDDLENAPVLNKENTEKITKKYSINCK